MGASEFGSDIRNMDRRRPHTTVEHRNGLLRKIPHCFCTAVQSIAPVDGKKSTKLSRLRAVMANARPLQQFPVSIALSMKGSLYTSLACKLDGFVLQSTRTDCESCMLS
ncbi:unnamed protein product [Ectocarpus sp. 12 AP-2014]